MIDPVGSIAPGGGEYDPIVAVTFVAATPSAAIDVGVSPLAELTAVLHALSDPAHHQPAVPLLQRADEAISDEARRELVALSPLWSGYRARFLLPGVAGLGRALSEELTLLLSYPAPHFFEAAAWAIRGGYTGAPPLVHMLEDPAARKDLLVRASARSSEALALMRDLLDDPARVAARIASWLDRCGELFFLREWPRLAETLSADATARQLLVARAGAVATLASLSKSAQVLDNPPRVRIEKVHHGRVELAHSPVMLIPSVTTWPHLLVKHEPGWPALVHYPLRDVSPAHRPPQVAVMQQRLAALTDATRLGLCRLIAQSPSTTSDLAARVGMSAPQVSRHLRVLRDAGLVERSRDGRRVRYRLHQEHVARLGVDLLGALLR